MCSKCTYVHLAMTPIGEDMSFFDVFNTLPCSLPQSECFISESPQSVPFKFSNTDYLRHWVSTEMSPGPLYFISTMCCDSWTTKEVSWDGYPYRTPGDSDWEFVVLIWQELLFTSVFRKLATATGNVTKLRSRGSSGFQRPYRIHLSNNH